MDPTLSVGMGMGRSVRQESVVLQDKFVVNYTYSDVPMQNKHEHKNPLEGRCLIDNAKRFG
jgi:hypothetical protein